MGPVTCGKCWKPSLSRAPRVCVCNTSLSQSPMAEPAEGMGPSLEPAEGMGPSIKPAEGMGLSSMCDASTSSGSSDDPVTLKGAVDICKSWQPSLSRPGWACISDASPSSTAEPAESDGLDYASTCDTSATASPPADQVFPTSWGETLTPMAGLADGLSYLSIYDASPSSSPSSQKEQMWKPSRKVKNESARWSGECKQRVESSEDQHLKHEYSNPQSCISREVQWSVQQNSKVNAKFSCPPPLAMPNSNRKVHARAFTDLLANASDDEYEPVHECSEAPAFVIDSPIICSSRDCATLPREGLEVNPRSHPDWEDSTSSLDGIWLIADDLKPVCEIKNRHLTWLGHWKGYDSLELTLNEQGKPEMLLDGVTSVAEVTGGFLVWDGDDNDKWIRASMAQMLTTEGLSIPKGCATPPPEELELTYGIHPDCESSVAQVSTVDGKFNATACRTPPPEKLEVNHDVRFDSEASVLPVFVVDDPRTPRGCATPPPEELEVNFGIHPDCDGSVAPMFIINSPLAPTGCTTPPGEEHPDCEDGMSILDGIWLIADELKPVCEIKNGHLTWLGGWKGYDSLELTLNEQGKPEMFLDGFTSVAEITAGLLVWNGDDNDKWIRASMAQMTTMDGLSIPRGCATPPPEELEVDYGIHPDCAVPESYFQLISEGAKRSWYDMNMDNAGGGWILQE